jgi:hypothetical protein
MKNSKNDKEIVQTDSGVMYVINRWNLQPHERPVLVQRVDVRMKGQSQQVEHENGGGDNWFTSRAILNNPGGRTPKGYPH